MSSAVITALILVFLLSLGAANAEDANRLMIVNGNTGRVLYDDGRDDLFCVTRQYVAGYTWSGRRVVRRTLRCR